MKKAQYKPSPDGSKPARAKPDPKEYASGVLVRCAHTGIADISMLKPHPRNPNKHSEAQIRLLAKAIKHQGWRGAIVVSKRSGYIVEGHGRLEAAKTDTYPLVAWAVEAGKEVGFTHERTEHFQVTAHRFGSGDAEVALEPVLVFKKPSGKVKWPSKQSSPNSLPN